MADSSEEPSLSLSSPEHMSSPPSSSATGSAAETEMGSSSEGQPEKRKRGRPRKPKPEQPEEPKEKRPRGRPKGSKNKSPSKAALLKNYSPQKRRGSRSRGGDEEVAGSVEASASETSDKTSQEQV